MREEKRRKKNNNKSNSQLNRKQRATMSIHTQTHPVIWRDVAGKGVQCIEHVQYIYKYTQSERARASKRALKRAHARARALWLSDLLLVSFSTHRHLNAVHWTRTALYCVSGLLLFFFHASSLLGWLNQAPFRVQ